MTIRSEYEETPGMPLDQLIQRLDSLAARLEDQGAYVDALLVTFAVERLGGEATNWTRVMDGLWKQQQENHRK